MIFNQFNFLGKGGNNIKIKNKYLSRHWVIKFLAFSVTVPKYLSLKVTLACFTEARTALVFSPLKGGLLYNTMMCELWVVMHNVCIMYAWCMMNVGEKLTVIVSNRASSNYIWYEIYAI